MLPIPAGMSSQNVPVRAMEASRKRTVWEAVVHLFRASAVFHVEAAEDAVVSTAPTLMSYVVI